MNVTKLDDYRARNAAISRAVSFGYRSASLIRAFGKAALKAHRPNETAAQTAARVVPPRDSLLGDIA